MIFTEADARLFAATLRHELLPTDATKQALDLAEKEHTSVSRKGEQEVGADRGEQPMPADDLAAGAQ